MYKRPACVHNGRQVRWIRMYEAIIVGASALFALMMFSNQRYQQLCGSGADPALRFALWTALIGAAAAWIGQGGRLEFTPFSGAVALWSSINGMLYVLCSLWALERADLTVFTTFSMLGGMLVPFAAGILFWHEPMTWQKALCCLLLTAAIVCNVQLPQGKGRREAVRGLFWDLAVFFLNGLGGLINKLHQSFPDRAVDSGSYSVLSRLFTVVLCLLLLSVRRRTPLLPLEQAKKRRAAWGSLLANGVLGLAANWILLWALLHVEASLSFALTTGSAIVFAALLSLCTRTPVSKRRWISVAASMAGLLVLAV